MYTTFSFMYTICILLTLLCILYVYNLLFYVYYMYTTYSSRLPSVPAHRCFPPVWGAGTTPKWLRVVK